MENERHEPIAPLQYRFQSVNSAWVYQAKTFLDSGKSSSANSYPSNQDVIGWSFKRHKQRHWKRNWRASWHIDLHLWYCTRLIEKNSLFTSCRKSIIGKSG
jgi:hypothetical protein